MSSTFDFDGTDQFDELIRTLTRGNDLERSRVIHTVRESTTMNRQVLSERLRMEIDDRYGPHTQRESAFTSSSPKQTPAIRSWLLTCLIWTDAEDEDNQRLITDHLIQQIEPESSIRYWVLAGIYIRNVSYLNQMVAMTIKDEASEVSGLATAIRSPESFASYSRELFSSPEYNVLWSVLRVMRIVPIPSLVEEVCALFTRVYTNGNIYYDAFYALSHPPMAVQAAPILGQKPGIQAIVDLMVEQLVHSDPNAPHHFAILLAAFPAAVTDQALANVRKETQHLEIVRQLQHHLSTYREKAPENEVFVAGYNSDANNVEDDRLGVGEDVQTLTAVMLAKEVIPPLAIGLFGDWGTGKSFFMSSMQEAAKKLAAKGNPLFCTHIVQIHFNAWHYADTNLWASLVSYILEKLAVEVAPQPTPEQQKAAFLSELGSVQAVKEEAKLEAEKTKGQIHQRQQELSVLQVQREEKEVSLRDLQVADIKKILGKDTKELEDSLNELGIPAALNSFSDLDKVITESYTVSGRITSLFFSILHSKNRGPVIFLLAAVLLIIPAGIWCIHHFIQSRFVTGLTAFIAELTAALTGITVIMRNGLTKMKKGLEKVQEVKKKIDETLADKKKTPTEDERKLQKEIDILLTKEQEAASRLSAATKRMSEIEQRIDALTEEGSLNHFLVKRTHSDDYRKHLGLISIIRSDFESLTEKLSKPDPEKGSFKRVERIILYIDDLDRCPPEKVLEVLQAVYLILAYPLFVVVVGVDSRWLIRSLRKTYTPLQDRGAGDDKDLWLTTPQNFLEKIFQIPFSLKPMTDTGYEKLVEGLFAPKRKTNAASPQESKDKEAVEKEATSTTTKEAEAGAAASSSTVPDETGKPTGAGEGDTNSFKSETESAAITTDRQGEFVISDEALLIKRWEINFAISLFQLMPNPRAVKRFTNVYRILKARVSREDLPHFEGTGGAPGEFQVPMLLLAILVGAPEEAAVLFPYLKKQAEKKEGMKSTLQGLSTIEPPLSLTKSFGNKLRPLITGGQFPLSHEPFIKWLPRVARFSFDLGKIIDHSPE